MKSYKLTATIFLLVIFFLNFNQNTKAQAGTLDASFGAGGVVPTLLVPNQQANALSDAALQADGKLVVAGGIIYRYDAVPYFDLNRFLLVRYKTDGTLDPEFGTNGVSAISVGYPAEAASVSILPDGKILAAGSSRGGISTNLVLARYHPNGSLDASFGTNGVTVDDFALPGEFGSEYPVESFVLPDDKILVVGKKLSISALNPKGTGADPMFSVFIARYNVDGAPDMSFGESGRLLNPSLSCGTMDSVTMQADGKILVSDRICKSVDMVSQITRYNPDGSMDAGFAQNGVLRFPPADEANQTKILPNGKILVLLRYNLMLFNADGGFERNIFSEPVLINGKEFFPSRFDLQTDGKIVVLGSVRQGYPAVRQVAVARFHANGRIDTTFGESGIFYRITNRSALPNQLLIQPDGKIIGIRGLDSNSPDTTLFRLLGGSSATDPR
jgi:uncharacterized delta-60 repeat protein